MEKKATEKTAKTFQNHLNEKQTKTRPSVIPYSSKQYMTS